MKFNAVPVPLPAGEEHMHLGLVVPDLLEH